MSDETAVVLPAGIRVNIMIYEKEKGPGILITCVASGTVEIPGFVIGNEEPVAILGGYDLDIQHGDPETEEKIKELLKASFGEEVLNPTLQSVQMKAREMGFPLTQ